MRLTVAAILVLVLDACAAPSSPPASAIRAGPGPQVLLIGEQHDATGHRRMQRHIVETLAAQHRLAALAVEMAEQGRSTAGLPAGASEKEVRSALHWNEAGWSWPTYAPVVMAAVRAGAPVLGANLAKTQMAAAMADAGLDGTLAAPALKAQQQAIRTGHCDLLPEGQIAPMTRIQIARDRSMAQVLEKAILPGKTVVLIAGNRHVDPQVGIPQHLRANVDAQVEVLPPEPQKKDYCSQLGSKTPAGMPAGQ
jgi:uncharacterized iron-regulated protein